MIHGVRILKYESDNLEVTAELDVTYEGGFSVTIEATVPGGIVIPVKVICTGFAGRVS